MPVNLNTKKRLISRVINVGIKRIKLDAEHIDDVADAITRENIRSLITANKITIKPINGTSRGRAQLKKIQKNKRGTTAGSKKGKKYARLNRKTEYVNKTRALRYRLKIAKDRNDITNNEFWDIYKKIKGNTIRNKAHLREIIKNTIEKRT